MISQFDGPPGVPDEPDLVSTTSRTSKESKESKDSATTSRVSSVTDGWLSRKSDADRKKVERASVPITPARSRLDPHAESYDMTHPRRGVALLFNHIHFKDMSTRRGTVKDCADLRRCLDRLGFQVRVYDDPTVKTITAVLKSTAAEDHSDADCLFVAVMSHGESGLVHSMDSLYPVDMLWTQFTGDRCATLAGKPKLFFIQACRGSRLDESVRVLHATDSRADTYSIPAFADIMVAYSTYDGFYSWRNPDVGAWFIQALCEELELHGASRDLLTIMTFVNRRVAVEYESYVPHNRDFHAKKQIPSVVSMLTRLVYFPPKKISSVTDDVIDEQRRE